MEIELGWGVHDMGTFGRLSNDGRTERAYLSRLLEVTDELDIPISFDIVGHLFLEDCSGSHDGPHGKGWFAADPGTDAEADGLFYAPDVVTDIRESKTNHELCTHTFSHVLFDTASREVCEWEIARVQELHSEHDSSPTRSLVPPRHETPPYDALTANGIDVIRPAMEVSDVGKVTRFKELLAGPLPASKLRERDGMTETYVTTFPSLTAASLPSGQERSHPAFRYLPTGLRQRFHLRKLKRTTREAAAAESHLHLWCHLFDVSNEPQFEVVRAYLRWLDGFRRAHSLEVATMEELPTYV